MLILQQFDGNILGPKILGDSTGLDSFWVLFSILLFGGLFGFAGMVLGVPVFAMFYSVISRLVRFGLRKNPLPEDTAVYLGKTGPMAKKKNNNDGRPKTGRPFSLFAPGRGDLIKYGRLAFGQTPDCYYMEVVRTFFR